MIQGRDLFKVILAVAAILALVFAALHFANSSGGKSSLSGDIPVLVISGTNSAGAVPALENFPSRSLVTKKSGYTGTLATKYRARQPVDCLAGSELSFAFPDGEPDKLRAYFTYYSRGSDKTDMYSGEYEALVYGGALTLPTEGMDFLVYGHAFYSYVGAGEPSAMFSSVAFFRLVATWEEDDFEYAFAVNLEDASASSVSVTGAGTPSSMPKIELSGINGAGEAVTPECRVALCVHGNGALDYIDALESAYQTAGPVALPAGSRLSFSLPNGEPDDIYGFYIFRSDTLEYLSSDEDIIQSTSEDPEIILQEEVKRLTLLKTKEKQAVIDANTILLPENPPAVGPDDTVSSPGQNIIYYKLIAAWGVVTYEYIFAVSLT